MYIYIYTPLLFSICPYHSIYICIHIYIYTFIDIHVHTPPSVDLFFMHVMSLSHSCSLSLSLSFSLYISLSLSLALSLPWLHLSFFLFSRTLVVGPAGVGGEVGNNIKYQSERTCRGHWGRRVPLARLSGRAGRTAPSPSGSGFR